MTPRGGFRPSNPGGRPPKPESEKGKMAAFRLAPDLILAIREGAERLCISQARLVTEAVRAFLKDARPTPVESGDGAPAPGPDD